MGDIEIARNTKLDKILEVAKRMNIEEDETTALEGDKEATEAAADEVGATMFLKYLDVTNLVFLIMLSVRMVQETKGKFLGTYVPVTVL